VKVFFVCLEESVWALFTDILRVINVVVRRFSLLKSSGRMQSVCRDTRRSRFILVLPLHILLKRSLLPRYAITKEQKQ